MFSVCFWDSGFACWHFGAKTSMVWGSIKTLEAVKQKQFNSRSCRATNVCYAEVGPENVSNGDIFVPAGCCSLANQSELVFRWLFIKNQKIKIEPENIKLWRTECSVHVENVWVLFKGWNPPDALEPPLCRLVELMSAGFHGNGCAFSERRRIWVGIFFPLLRSAAAAVSFL